MDKKLKDGFIGIKSKYWTNEELEGNQELEWKMIDLSEEVELIINRIVAILFFDETDPRKIDGIELTTYIADWMVKSFKTSVRPFSFFTFDILGKLGIDPMMVAPQKMFARLTEECNKMYLERVKLRKSVPYTSEMLNILDMIREDDETLPEGKKWTPEEISQNLTVI